MFVRVLLSQSHGAVDCAKALLPHYPFPAPDDEWWETPTGELVRAYGSQVEMTPENMFRSPSAACVRLFPAQWRCAALKDAEARIVKATSVRDLIDQLLELYIVENNCSRQYARLQLVAASVHPIDATSGEMRAYMTYDNTGCHLYTEGVDPTRPTTACFTDMQDELNMAEQLAYLILTTDMSSEFRRIAFNQPLALGTCTDGTNGTTILGFCADCRTNWDTDASGNVSGIRVCPEQGCSYMIHETCCGRTAGRCPAHTSQALRTCEIQRTGRSCTGDVLACSGLVPMHGAWCLLLGYWPAKPNCPHAVGMLHPMSIASVVQTTDDHVSSGRWFALHPNMAGLTEGQCIHGMGRGHRRLYDMLAEMHCLYHLDATRTVPCTWHGGQRACHTLSHCREASADLAHAPAGLYYPGRHALGQLEVTSPPVLRLSASLATVLAALQVYSEPHFSRMCARFECNDALIIKWMKLGLPLLPGDTCAGYTDTKARTMHAQVQGAVLTAKTRQRALQRGRCMRHWVVLQADPVLPSCPEHDTACLLLLGITEALPQAPPCVAPAPTPDTTVQGTMDFNVSGHGVFAVRLMMNPSLYQRTLDWVMRTCTCYDLTGAVAVFMDNEIPPIPRVLTVQAAIDFRTACIRSPLYGRMYMYLITNGSMYTDAVEVDTTGILATTAAKPGAEWRGDWCAVNELCECTGSAYVGFGCGDMQHWRTVLMNDRAAYLFENHLPTVKRIACLGMAAAHLIPCAWHGLTLDDLGTPRVTVVAHRANPTTPEPGTRTVAHYMSIADLELPRAHKYMALHGPCEWKHYAGDKLDTEAAYTRSTYHAMRPKHRAGHRE